MPQPPCVPFPGRNSPPVGALQQRDQILARQPEAILELRRRCGSQLAKRSLERRAELHERGGRRVPFLVYGFYPPAPPEGRQHPPPGIAGEPALQLRPGRDLPPPRP